MYIDIDVYFYLDFLSSSLKLDATNASFLSLDRVSAQRQQFKTMNQMSSVAARRAAPLTQDRIELLNKLGFTWTIRSRDSLGESWNLRLEELKKFKERHGVRLVHLLDWILF
jgi:hypothetical protein